MSSISPTIDKTKCRMDDASFHYWLSQCFLKARNSNVKGLAMLPSLTQIERQLEQIDKAVPERMRREKLNCKGCEVDQDIAARAAIVLDWYNTKNWINFLDATKHSRMKMGIFNGQHNKARKRVVDHESLMDRWT